MTPTVHLRKSLVWLVFAAIAIASSNCSTTYDSYGRPRQSVDPGLAVAGVAAAGVLGYAAAKNKNNRRSRDKHYHRDHRYRDDRHRGDHYRSDYYGPPRGGYHHYR